MIYPSMRTFIKLLATVMSIVTTYDDCTRQQDGSSSPSVHKDPRRECSEQIDNGIDASHKDGLSTNPAGRLKYSRGVIRNDIDTILPRILAYNI